MNVCLVHEEYPEETNFGGIATYQKTLAEELVKKGHTVYVITRGMTKNYQYVENGVHITRIFVNEKSNSVKYYIEYRKQVAKAIRKLQDRKLIDIIEVPDWGAETIFFEPFRKIPLVVRLHTPLKIWLKYNQNNFGKITKKMLYWENKMLQSADCVTCCSQILKEKILEEFDLQKDILVTPNPANVINFYYDNKIKKENKLLFVGSLEERKGVVVLAHALNIVFKKYPELKIDFVGKDTIRNSNNISTIEVIKQIVNKKYHKNINFVGQISNFELNKYFNNSLVGIFPSLFDNFPYVVLESMATGLQIVGSKNSGMVEMLDDLTAIYETPDYQDLAKKIIYKYELSKKEPINKQNIIRVKEKYNASKICDGVINLYNDIIYKYSINTCDIEELNAITKKVLNTNVLSFRREKNGVANKVYLVKTVSGYYIVKKYLYDYDFELANDLYNVYITNNINVIKPINKKIINYKGFRYNVFNYVKKDLFSFNVNYMYLKNIVCIKDKSVSMMKYTSVITEKCQKYYKFLRDINDLNYKINNEDILYVLNIYKDINNIKLLDENYLNHGDISMQNIICSDHKLYLIDFDETCIAPRLYDFAVVVVKILAIKYKINIIKYNKFKNMVKIVYPEYTDRDYQNIIKFYLCKILLEKFYLHQLGKIDLYSKHQLKDDYKRYLKMLKQLDEIR